MDEKPQLRIAPCVALSALCLCLQLQSSQVAEHLVQSIIDASAVQEVIATAAAAAGAASSTAPQQHGADPATAAAAAAMAAEFEVEMSRLRSRINHLRAQNTLLNVTLEESKCTCTRLAVLMGKYESNETALQLASGSCEQLLEAQDALLLLLDSQQTVLLAKRKSSALGSTGTNSSRNRSRDSSRH